ncbi:CHAP domain-containing protein [Streptomyces sp. NPDC001493]
MFRRNNLTALALTVCLFGGPVVGQAAADTVPVAQKGSTAASKTSFPSVRSQIVANANRALTKPTKYRTSKKGSVRLSKPKSGSNYLGGKNLNEYNNFNGDPWCGYFAAAMWGKRGVPSSYASSQAWRGLGSRYHAYNVNRLPQPGDVLVWTNKGDRAHGHVGVVVGVKGRTVTTIEGNTGAGDDSVTRKVYNWGNRGPALPGKTFRGSASPR